MDGSTSLGELNVQDLVRICIDEGAEPGLLGHPARKRRAVGLIRQTCSVRGLMIAEVGSQGHFWFKDGFCPDYYKGPARIVDGPLSRDHLMDSDTYE